MKFFIAGLILLISSYGYASETSSVIEESDFQTLSLEMKKKSMGLLLMFHAEHCHYCDLMDAEILSPMVKSGDYDNKVLIRKLQFDEARDIKDFSGKVMEPSDFGAYYNVMLTPTLIFLDSQGNEKAKKMVGINTVEYFGAYLDEEIEKLQKNILADKHAVKKTDKTTAQK